MSNNVQISRELFVSILQYFLTPDLDEDTQRELFDFISNEVDEKLDKMVARELFSKYKTATTSEQREQARKKYLDHKGIMSDWRTDTEIKTER